MHVTKIVQFDWSAVFESLWYKKFAAAFYSVLQVSKVCFICLYLLYLF